jgi:hypothetical protein
MEQQNSTTPQTNSWKLFAIIGLVLGILALLFSFIPCLGMYAIFPGVIGLILGVVAMMQAGKVNAPKGMAIAAIICAVLGSAVAGYQYYKLKSIVDDPSIKKGLEDFKNSMDSLKRASDSILKALPDSVK